ncbi:MAG: helix-turn-helix domain-containing protein [Solirubrobacteraceae bacterium]|nr:helix-turn-helix domain-containing protein [Solirubrobacteraceae bacterium]
MATTRTIRHLAAVLRGRRLDLDLTQADVAARAGVSRQWLSGLERGRAGAEVGLVLRVLDVLDLRMDLTPVDAGPSTASAGPGRPGDHVDLDEWLEEYGRDDRDAAPAEGP